VASKVKVLFEGLFLFRRKVELGVAGRGGCSFKIDCLSEELESKGAVLCLELRKLHNAALCHPWHRVIPTSCRHKKADVNVGFFSLAKYYLAFALAA
jgi:hypothetical protein